MKKLAFLSAALCVLSFSSYAETQTAQPVDPVTPPLSNTLSEANNTPATVEDAFPGVDGKEKTLPPGQAYAWNNRDSESDQIDLSHTDGSQDEVDNEYYE